MTGLEIVPVLQVLSLGLRVVNQTIALHESLGSQEGRRELEAKELRGLIGQSMDSLRQAIEIGAEKVIDKLEQDKMEELVSRIRNIDMLLRMNKKEQVLSYVLQVREAVDYAKNRLDEGKRHWMTPYMTGVSMIVASFDYLGEPDEDTTEELSQAVREARNTVLNEVTRTLFQNNVVVPWDLVGDVFYHREGAVEELVALLPEKASPMTKSSSAWTDSKPTKEELKKRFSGLS